MKFKQDNPDLFFKREKFQMNDSEIMEVLGFKKTEELQKLRQRIANLNGHIRMTVHPFYSRFTRNERDHDKRVMNHFFRSVYSAIKNKNSAPLFVFEGESDLLKTQQLISSVGNGDGSVFLLPTDDGNGWPKFKDTHSREEDHKKSIAFFNSLGVKSITVSGMYLFSGPIFPLEGCVGRLVHPLIQNGFSVDFSNAISYSDYPISLADIRNKRTRLSDYGLGKKTGRSK